MTWSNCRCRAMLALMALLAIIVPLSSEAHQERLPAPHQFERVYELSEPLGTTRLNYRTASEGEPPRLVLKTERFETAVPPKGLSDVPRPDWQAARLATSPTSYDEDEGWVQRPYVSIRVPIYGPVDDHWERTWVLFHFDHQGRLTRRILRQVQREAGDHGHTRTVRQDWPIDSPDSAVEVLEEMDDDTEK